MSKVTYVCGCCGSDNVSKDAFVDWNITNQEWDLVRAVYDEATCHDCGDSTRLVEQEINDTDSAQMGVSNQESNNASDVHK
jgi:hypothetical protein